ncbi:MAG: DUF6657 family protein [Spirochaetaceae bacterium]
MGEIKSALELALERTSDVKGDPKSIEAHEHRQVGKKLLSQLREDPHLDLKKELKSYSKEQVLWIKEGLYEVSRSAIALPAAEDELAHVRTLRKALEQVVRDTRSLNHLFDQVEQIFSQYLQNRQQIIESLRNQYSQRARQQEEELSKQYGRQVRVDPANDPEFQNALQQNLRQLQQQYQGVVDQVRQELDRLFQASK